MSDLSRVEQLLRNALGEDIYEVTPQSRVEALLVELNELIEEIDSSVSPEDIATAVAAYLDEHLTNPTNPPVDTSLAIAGAAADAKKTGDEIGALKEGLSDVYGGAFNDIVGWVSGEYIDKTNGSAQSNANYKRTDYIEISPEAFNVGIISQDPVGAYDPAYNGWYDANKAFISNFAYTVNGSKILTPPTNAKYFRLSCRNVVTLTIFPSYVTTVTGTMAYTKDLHDTVGFIVPEINGWLDGKYISNTDGSEMTNNSYHATDYIALNPKLGNITLTSSNAGSYGANFNAWYDENKEFISTIQYVRNGSITLTPPANARYFRLSCNKTVVLTLSTTYEDKTLVDLLPPNTYTGNYIITSSLHKVYVDVAKLSGALKYTQSFCMYGGKYYSTNGTNISEQDSTFTELRNAVVSVGHGNSFQLGHNGKAYISGWNDNKVYVVDLATLTVEDTITLPTTGYTTCAVDDIRKVAYIFQRDTYPDTEAPYTFIVYDYDNEQTLYTKQTAPFSAMQACDMYNDSIIVLNGLGGVTTPNHCKVYDINGAVTGQYILPNILSSGEPEGVFFDRNTCDIYISKENKDFYKITQ